MGLGRQSRPIELGFRAGLVLIAAATLGTAVGARQHEADSGWVTHTNDVRAGLDEMLVDVAELHDPERAVVAAQQLRRGFVMMRQLTGDNSLQQQRLDRMAPLLSEPGAHVFAVRAFLILMRDEEAELRQQRRERERISLYSIYASTSLGLLLAIALLLSAWSLLKRHVRSQTEALEKLKRAEAQSAALLDNGTDLVWAVDDAMRISASNKRFRNLVTKIVGYDVDEEMRGGGLSFAQYEPWYAAFRRALDGEHVTIESPQEIDGRTRHFLISFGPVVVDGRVTGAAAFAKDITTRKRAEAKLAQRAETLHYLSVVDPLTQLHNRRGFLELGGVLLRDARAHGQSVQLLFADVDGLKQVNDRQGHAAGDALICKAGEVLAESVRRSDVVARLGGDEFVVLAAGSDEDDTLLERIQRRAGKASVQLSIGVIKSEPGDELAPLELLIERADALMYEQKLARKRRVIEPAASVAQSA